MTELDGECLDLIRRFPLGLVATVTPDGRPAVSPKGTFLVRNAGELAFGEIRSPGTLRNLRANPALEINFVDPFLRKAVRVQGEARLLDRASPDYASLLPEFAAKWPALAPRIGTIVTVAVTGGSLDDHPAL